jgi:hypothetical protein
MAQNPQNKWERLDWLQGDPAAPRPPLSSERIQYRPPPPAARTEIDYRPPIGRIVLGVVLSCVGGLFMAHEARTNDRGMIINGLIELSPHGATVLKWVVSAALFALGAGLLLLVPRGLIRRQIVLDADSITIPSHGLSRRQHRIEREDIRGVQVTQYYKMRYLRIRHHGGVRAINSTWLPHEEDLDTILKWLDAARRTRPTPPASAPAATVPESRP